VPPDNLPLLHHKSDRVLRLTASCVQTAIRLCYAYEMSMSEAVDLARIHDVRSAVRVFGEKLELFNSVPRPTRFRLAATEATFTSGVIPEDDLIHTVAVRRASIGTISEHERAGISRLVLVAHLREVRRASEQWAREYGGFMDRIALLHMEGVRDLKLLRLEPETGKRADGELERVILVALRKAGELVLSVQAVT
jgi:hypothetical protein